MKFNKFTNSRTGGFTLIELLVVIAIIGILSSIVLASLSTARSKGNDAKVKEQLSGVRSAAEIFYGNQNPNSYGASNMSSAASVCSGSMFTDPNGSGLNGLTGSSAAWPSGTLLSCQAASSSYAVSASLSTGYWCVDSNGSSIATTSQLASGITKCQ